MNSPAVVDSRDVGGQDERVSEDADSDLKRRRGSGGGATAKRGKTQQRVTTSARLTPITNLV